MYSVITTSYSSRYVSRNNHSPSHPVSSAHVTYPPSNVAFPLRFPVLQGALVVFISCSPPKPMTEEEHAPRNSDTPPRTSLLFTQWSCIQTPPNYHVDEQHLRPHSAGADSAMPTYAVHASQCYATVVSSRTPAKPQAAATDRVHEQSGARRPLIFLSLYLHVTSRVGWVIVRLYRPSD